MDSFGIIPFGMPQCIAAMAGHHQRWQMRWALMAACAASEALNMQDVSGAPGAARAPCFWARRRLCPSGSAGLPPLGSAEHCCMLRAGIDSMAAGGREPLRMRGGAGRGLGEAASDGCLNPLLVTLLTCILSPRAMWRAEKHVPYVPGDHGDVLWGTEDMDAHDSFDTLTAGLNQRIGSLPTPTIEHGAIKRRRQLGTGGFAVVFEADIPGKGKKSGGWSRTCACKVFSFIAGMGERQTNFFKNWLHELKVLEYLTSHPECGVVDFYGFSLRHEEAEAKIIVQICMELMRGGSLRDNLLVLKRKVCGCGCGCWWGAYVCTYVYTYIHIHTCIYRARKCRWPLPTTSCGRSPLPSAASTSPSTTCF